MVEMVCPHCGHDEYNEIIKTIANHEGIKEEVGYLCSSKSCEEFFTEPIEDYEFNEAAREAKLEDEADERRDMGL